MCKSVSLCVGLLQSPPCIVREVIAALSAVCTSPQMRTVYSVLDIPVPDCAVRNDVQQRAYHVYNVCVINHPDNTNTPMELFLLIPLQSIIVLLPNEYLSVSAFCCLTLNK